MLPTMSEIAAIGRMVMNSQRQLPTDRIAPATTGPSDGATDVAMVRRASIRPVRDGGTRAVTAVKANGVTIAVPTAWMIRPISRTLKSGAAAATMVPRTNSDIASV